MWPHFYSAHDIPGPLHISYESTRFNFLGFLMALAASVLAGVRWTYTQLIMQKRSDLGLSIHLT
ncbi:Solute carrier family 35 member C2 [Caligus rogercresseyi]|uniref:Solute carrier family 35 member C2 n=1 Tax=Caligus rogercresseyi TaxID=217165 RepID=A0A7T8QTU7_CALRO|nr:Solute carrier family 35 member C2 [Caligus rogercresseyi]